MKIHPLIPINNTLYVWDAVVAWRDHVFTSYEWGSTKSSYVRNMLKIIEADVVKVTTELTLVTPEWLESAKKKIDEITAWANNTKSVRKSILTSFYKYIHNEFDWHTFPYQWHPTADQINQALSSVEDTPLTKNLCPELVCNTLLKTNERDALIVWLMLNTGHKLETILDLPKTALRMPYIDIKGSSHWLPEQITQRLKIFCDTSHFFLFETSSHARMARTQLIRNIKRTGKKLGLEYELSPKLLTAYANIFICNNKKSVLQQLFS